jgi:hypothetical protein
VLRAIQKKYKGQKLTSANSIYTVLTQIASDASMEEYETWGIKIMEMAGVGYATLRKILNDFEEIGLISRHQERTKKGTYGKLEIILLEVATDSQSKPNGKAKNKVGKKVVANDLQSIESNKENSSEVNEENVCKKVSRQESANGVIDSEENTILVFTTDKDGDCFCKRETESFVRNTLIKVNLIRIIKKYNPSASGLYENEDQMQSAISMISNEDIGYAGIYFRARELAELHKAESLGFEFEYPIPHGLTFIQIANNYVKIKKYYKRMRGNDEYMFWREENVTNNK